MSTTLRDGLTEAVAKRQVLVVVGAGVSVAATGADIAGWVGLLENGVSRCEELGLSPAKAEIWRSLLPGPEPERSGRLHARLLLRAGRAAPTACWSTRGRGGDLRQAADGLRAPFPWLPAIDDDEIARRCAADDRPALRLLLPEPPRPEELLHETSAFMTDWTTRMEELGNPDATVRESAW